MHTFQNIRGREGGWPRLSNAALHKPLYKVSFHKGVRLLTEPEGARAPARPHDVMKTEFGQSLGVGTNTLKQQTKQSLGDKIRRWQGLPQT